MAQATKDLKPQNFTQVTLSEPIQRGDKSFTEISLREPRAGDLKGIVLFELITMKSDAFPKVLKRIADPIITEEEFDGMIVKDALKLMRGVTGFLGDTEDL